jgi:hypothetical protein
MLMEGASITKRPHKTQEGGFGPLHQKGEKTMNAEQRIRLVTLIGAIGALMIDIFRVLL